MDFEQLVDMVNSCAYDIVRGGEVTKVDEMQGLLHELASSDKGALLVAGLLVHVDDEQYKAALALTNKTE